MGRTVMRAVASAIAAVVVIGCQGGAATTTVPPSTAPSRTAAPPSPTLPTTGSPPLEGSLAPGRYTLEWSGPPASIEVPAAGWTGLASGVGKDLDPAAGEEADWWAWPTDTYPVTDIFHDACRRHGTDEPVDGTVDALVEALEAQKGTDSAVSDVTFGRVSGKRVDLATSVGLDAATCDAGILKVWSGYYALAPGDAGIVLALDVDGDVAIFVGTIGPKTPAADVAELESIIASLSFDP